MKRMLVALISLLMILPQINRGYACTSFAVYSEEPVYAMNFDYPETEIRFIVVDNSDLKAFFMQFDYMTYKEGNQFASTLGMNSKGLFTTLQMQYPQLTGKRNKKKDEIYIYELVDFCAGSENVPEVLRAVENRKFIHMEGLTLHSMLADTEGNAVIAEVGKDQNELLPITGDFIVMTNFKNSDYRDKPFNKVSGAGADRYIKAWQYIEENRDGFCLDNALECLKMTAQQYQYPTLASAVFVPDEQSVYIALRREFEKLWKISLQDGTIEAYKGFEENIKFTIPDEGVLASDLLNNDFSKYEAFNAAESSADGSKTGFIYPVIAASVIAVLLLIYLFRKRQKA